MPYFNPTSAESTGDCDSGRSPRILITRLSAIGDCILTMPLAVALRASFPQAFIAWAVEGVTGTMIERHPAVDLAIRLPRHFARSPLVLWRLRSRLRTFRFDIAIDPQSLTKSALVAWASGARRRVGFARPLGRELSPWLNTELVSSDRRHVVERYLDLLRPLEAVVPPAQFDFPRDPANDVKMHSEIQSLGLRGPLAVLNPGAGWESKRWPTERYAEVAQGLAQRWGASSLVVWAGDQERAMAEQVACQADGNARLAPATTLLELAALLRQACIFVGSDTGPLHMAAAVGTPCVGIYGPTRAEECGPYGPGHQTVQAWYQAGSSRQRRSGTNAAMRDVPAEWVLEACGQILAGRTTQSVA